MIKEWTREDRKKEWYSGLKEKIERFRTRKRETKDGRREKKKGKSWRENTPGGRKEKVMEREI